MVFLENSQEQALKGEPRVTVHRDSFFFFVLGPTHFPSPLPWPSAIVLIWRVTASADSGWPVLWRRWDLRETSGTERNGAACGKVTAGCCDSEVWEGAPHLRGARPPSRRSPWNSRSGGLTPTSLTR